MIRRYLAAFCGFAALGFIGWNVYDGVIYFHGNGVTRSEHPFAFWLEAALLSLAACSFIYAGLFSKHKPVEKA